MKDKSRLDTTLTEKNITESRQIAQSYIIQGLVKVNGTVRTKPGFPVSGKDIIELLKPSRVYVSRGGLKLEHALNEFNINPENKTAMDAGASTGGFTDCLLKKGASKVYAVDVGKGQLDYNLRNNERVISIEDCNIRYLDENILTEKVDLITADVSFISITKIINVLSDRLKDTGSLIALIKPQFEAGKGKTIKGVIKDKSIHAEVLKNALDYGAPFGLFPHNMTYSPIKGPSGNIEFFILYKKQTSDTIFYIDDLVNKAWEILNK